MKQSFKILLLILFPLTGFASGQVSDILIYKGDTLMIFSDPLEDYFERKSERTINGYELENTSIYCFRGCRATWELKNDSLFLIKVQKGCISNTPEYFDLKAEFGTESVFAEWFTGNILSPHGEMIHYVRSNIESFFEKELLFSISQGLLTEQKEYDNSKSFRSVFSEKQDSLEAFIYTSINWRIIPDLHDETRKVFISFQSGETLKPDSIEIARASDDDLLNAEALRVVGLLPEWNVYYRRGKVERVKWVLPIVFSEEKREKYAR